MQNHLSTLKRISILLVMCLFASSVALAQQPAKPATAKPANKPTTTTTKTTNTNQPTKQTVTNPPINTNSQTTKPRTEVTSPTTTTQPKPQTPAVTDTSKRNISSPVTIDTTKYTLDCFVIGANIGAGVGLGAKIVNSGIFGETHVDLMAQFKRHRLGIGWNNQLNINLYDGINALVHWDAGRMIINKYYLSYEWWIFRKSVFNLGFGLKFGGYNYRYLDDDKESINSTLFVVSLPMIEVGHPRYLLFIRPDFGYMSQGSFFSTQIYFGVSLGFRYKTKYSVKKKK